MLTSGSLQPISHLLYLDQAATNLLSVATIYSSDLSFITLRDKVKVVSEANGNERKQTEMNETKRDIPRML